VSFAGSVDGSTIFVGSVVVVPASDFHVAKYAGAAVLHSARHWMHQSFCSTADESFLQNDAGQYLGLWLQLSLHHASVHVLAMHLYFEVDVVVTADVLPGSDRQLAATQPKSPWPFALMVFMLEVHDSTHSSAEL